MASSSSSIEPTLKLTKGKRKIAIEPIISKTRKQVTFSKRRVGLFKKASELSSMCGADVAVITFSSGGKLFSFGNPNADFVIRRYINSSLETVIKEGGCIGNNVAENSGFWWDRPVDDLGLTQLEEFKVALEGLRDEVVARLDISSLLD